MLLTHLLELKWNNALSKNFNFSEIKGLKLPKLGKIDLQFAFLHLRILRTTQDFFKALFDFNHTKINLRTLYGPIVSFISYVHMFSSLYTKISSLRPKNHQFCSFMIYNSHKSMSVWSSYFKIATYIAYMKKFFLSVRFSWMYLEGIIEHKQQTTF